MGILQEFGIGSQPSFLSFAGATMAKGGGRGTCRPSMQASAMRRAKSAAVAQGAWWGASTVGHGPPPPPGPRRRRAAYIYPLCKRERRDIREFFRLAGFDRG